MAVGRNSPCPCGSGKKYKRCCALKPQNKTTLGGWAMLSAVALMLAAGAAIMLSSLDDTESTGPSRVWSAEHGHWH